MSFKNKRTGKSLKTEFDDAIKQVDQLISKELPAEAMEQLQDQVNDSFSKEQFQDGKSPKWKARKDDSEANFDRSERRALLIKSEIGIESIEAEVLSTDGKTVGIGTDNEYMPVHNEGGRAGRGKGFDMPQRQHMPIPGEPNPKVEEALDNFMDDALDKIFK